MVYHVIDSELHVASAMLIRSRWITLKNMHNSLTIISPAFSIENTDAVLACCVVSGPTIPHSDVRTWSSEKTSRT